MLRIVVLIVGLAIGIFFVMRYAEKVKADPSKSLVYAQKAENEKHFLAGQEPERNSEHLPGAESRACCSFSWRSW